MSEPNDVEWRHERDTRAATTPGVGAALEGSTGWRVATVFGVRVAAAGVSEVMQGSGTVGGAWHGGAGQQVRRQQRRRREDRLWKCRIDEINLRES